jgi:hypothetical protein
VEARFAGNRKTPDPIIFPDTIRVTGIKPTL